MPEPMTDLDLARLKALADSATPGPWGWFGSTRHDFYLATRHSGRRYVMGFKRKGMRNAEPTFQVKGVMVPASSLAIYEVAPEATSKDDPSVYREDIIGFRHPDAAYIAALSPDVAIALIARVERAEAALRAWRDWDLAEDASLELYERAEAEDWRNDPTGSMHLHSAVQRANDKRSAALALRDTALAALETK